MNYLLHKDKTPCSFSSINSAVTSIATATSQLVILLSSQNGDCSSSSDFYCFVATLKEGRGGEGATNQRATAYSTMASADNIEAMA